MKYVRRMKNKDMVQKFSKKKNRIFAAILLGCMAISFAGCGAQKQASTEVKKLSIAQSAGTVQLYYIVKDNQDGTGANELQVLPQDSRYQLKQPDSIASSVEEVMDQLTMPSGVIFTGYTLDADSNVRLRFSVADNISEEMLLMTKAMIVRSIDGLSQVGDVALEFHGTGAEGTAVQDGVEIATYTDSSFFYYDDAEDSAKNVGDVVLYLPNGNGSLKKVVANVTIGADDSAQEAVLRQLIAYEVLPKGTKVNQVSLMNGSATVDLSEEFLKDTGSISPKIVIYSIVDSLTSLPNISKVQILVAGEKVEKYHDEVSIAGPLEFVEPE